MFNQTSKVKKFLTDRYERIQALCMLRFLQPYAFPWAWDYYIAIKEPNSYRLCKLAVQSSLVSIGNKLLEFRSSEAITTADDLFTALQVTQQTEAILKTPSSPWYAFGESHLIIETPFINRYWVWQEKRHSRIMTDAMVEFLWNLQTKVNSALGEHHPQIPQDQ